MRYNRFFPGIIIWSFCFLGTLGSKAEIQSLPFRRISPPGGFTLSPVIQIAQDKQGFIWFITRDKLYQYNSQDFINFDPKFQTGTTHTNNYITSMLIDRSNTIWVGTNAGINRFNKSAWQLDAFRVTDREMPGKVIYPTDIKQNQKGDIWMIENNNLARLDTVSWELKYIRTNNGRLIVNAFCFDPDDNVYAANNLGELYRVNATSLQVTKLEVDLSPVKLYGIFLINNMLWVSTDGYGLRRYSKDGRLIDSYFTKHDINDAYSGRIRDVLKTSDGKIWIATYKGLIEWKENNFNQYLSDFGSQFSLPDNSVTSLMEDNQKGLWIGTWRGGVGYLNNYANSFETYLHSPFENSVSGNVINTIAETRDGDILIGTDGQGLDSFNEQRKIFRHIDLKGTNNVAVNNIKCIYPDKLGNIWLGTYGEGIFLQKSGESGFHPFILDKKNVYDITGDEEGIWVGCWGSGLYYYRFSDRSLTQFVTRSNDSTSISSNNLRKVVLDPFRNLWIISSTGLSIKPAMKNGFERVLLDNGSVKIPPQVYSIAVDKNNLVWIGTDRGLFSIDASRKISHHPIVFNGKLVAVNGIAVLGPETIWLSSNFGIFSYNPVTGNSLNYSSSDGLHGNLFNAGALCQTTSGKIYFGSTTGMVSFHPASMQANPYKPKIYFSRIFINHREILPGQPNSPLRNPLSETALIRMEPGQNSFSIEFVAQNYLNPQKNQFRYRLRNFDPNWVDAGSISKATYTNISPGKYVFEVIACNNDGVWNLEPAALTIVIPRPLLLSWPALVVYFILLAGLAVLVRRIILYRARLEHEIELERLQRQEEEKSHQNKLSFFTNISHELRTPLTLIAGPVESLMKSTTLDQSSFNQLSLIKRNAGRLLKLINQLLDFRRIEENMIELTMVKTDLVVFVHDLFNYFIDVAKQKNINYLFSSLQDQVVLSFDPEKIDKAIFNLLSNAFKFTPERGTIQVEIAKGQKGSHLRKYANVTTIGGLKTKNFIQIAVEDNGPGIAMQDLEKVFDRFYRVEKQEFPHSGTGIGLHLTKHLVLLHGGEIELETESGKGSIFRIRLPYQEDTAAGLPTDREIKIVQAAHPEYDDQLVPGMEADAPFSENWNNRAKNMRKSDKLVMVVEDHPDLSNFICQILEEEYRIIRATTGSEGIEKAQVYLPDLIISDIMMPGKSGLELVSELKNNLRTSHIPIILLTALTSAESKIKGFSSGADDYIEKPFDGDVLKARIKNIFAGRLAMQQYYSQKMVAGFTGDLPESPDQKMMTKAISYVEKNLQDESLDIEKLASHLNLSQSTLYRKLKSLTGKSAIEFIRTIRLEYAARLLRDGSYNIEEVSGLAGFNSHSYFSKSFREHFGMTPSEYVSMKPS